MQDEPLLGVELVPEVAGKNGSRDGECQETDGRNRRQRAEEAKGAQTHETRRHASSLTRARRHRQYPKVQSFHGADRASLTPRCG